MIMKNPLISLLVSYSYIISVKLNVLYLCHNNSLNKEVNKKKLEPQHCCTLKKVYLSSINYF